jgi:hypothetical protein
MCDVTEKRVQYNILSKQMQLEILLIKRLKRKQNYVSITQDDSHSVTSHYCIDV